MCLVKRGLNAKDEKDVRHEVEEATRIEDHQALPEEQGHAHDAQCAQPQLAGHTRKAALRKNKRERGTILKS